MLVLEELLNLFDSYAAELDVHPQDVQRLMAISLAELRGNPHNISSLARASKSSTSSTYRWVQKQKDIIINIETNKFEGASLLTISPEYRVNHTYQTRNLYIEFIRRILNGFSK